MRFLVFILLALSSLSGTAQGGNPLLTPAFWQGAPSPQAVQAELSKGHSPSEMTANAMDPVVLAINGGAPNASVRLLLEQPGNEVNKITHDSRTYIFWAASKGNDELVQYLLSKGARTDLQDSHGSSPVLFAAGGGQQNTRVYDLLLPKGADLRSDLNHDGANALLVAVGNDPEGKLTEYFISKGLSLQSTDAAGRTAFDYAARGGNLPLMKALKAKGVAHTDGALLMAAAGSRRGPAPLEVFQYLESLGIAPTATSKAGDNVLHFLARRPGGADLIAHFLAKGVSPDAANEEGTTPFMNAAAGNRDTALLALLAPKVKDLNGANRAGATALALAVRSNSPEAVAFLLERGARVDVSDAKGASLTGYLFESYTPRTAADFDKKRTLLQARGLNLSLPQKDGSTVYHLAVAKGDLALLQAVHRLGADINARNREGLTALHKAAMISRDDTLLQFLLAGGARKEVKTDFDETAYDLARENEALIKGAVSVTFLKSE